MKNEMKNDGKRCVLFTFPFIVHESWPFSLYIRMLFVGPVLVA